MTKFKLGIVLETAGLPARQALAVVSRIGVAGVQANAAGELSPDVLGETARREFRTLVRSYNLELAALNCPLRRGLDSAEHQQQRIEHVRKAMQLAFDLGPRTVVVPLPKLPTDEESSRAKLLREALLDLSRYGDRIGTRVAVEAGFDAGDKVRDYLATFDSGSLTVAYDPANFLLNGHDPIASLMSLAGRVGYVQARDARTQSLSGGGKEVPVGAGEIEWMTFVATLDATDYRGCISVDREDGNDRLTDATDGAKFLRRFVVG